MTDTLDRYEIGDRASLFFVIFVLAIVVAGLALSFMSLRFAVEHGPVCTIARDGEYVVFTWLGGKDITFLDSVEYMINNESIGKLLRPRFSDFGKEFRYPSPYPSDGKVVLHWGDGPDWELVRKVV